MTKREAEALHRLALIMGHIADAKENWPTMDVDTEGRDWQWPIEGAYDWLEASEWAIEGAIMELLGYEVDLDEDEA